MSNQNLDCSTTHQTGSSSLQPRCIERPGVLIPGTNRTQPSTMTSPDVYDYYDVWKWGNRLTLGLNAAVNIKFYRNCRISSV